jgi:hypothetical protein
VLMATGSAPRGGGCWLRAAENAAVAGNFDGPSVRPPSSPLAVSYPV